ncbi:MAG TPA: NADH-quinone oxidoreductase subunit K [Armatimonadota bacterium]|nr:NADH-quinone oxidoreductase subunit K [Armatimonadota bacterium]
MSQLTFEPVAAVAVVLGLAMLGVTRLDSSFWLYGIQTVGLGALAVWMGAQHGELTLVVVGSAVALLKGVGVPIYLARAASRINCRRDADTIIAPPLQLFLSLAALALLILVRPFNGSLPISTLPAIGLLMLGMLMMITRRLAISQIIGFLVLENGIFLYTIAQPHTMPFVVEIGALMDVLAATMLAGLLTFKISRSFEHIDVARLKELKG